MKFGMLAAILTIMLTGCTRSATDMLKNGDPHVCANSSVQSDLFSIIRQHAQNPYPAEAMREMGFDQNSVYSKISISADGITSKKIDTQSQKVDCNATVTMSASGTPYKASKIVDYEVAPDLTDESKILVVADIAEASSAFQSMMGSVLEVPYNKLKKQQFVDSVKKSKLISSNLSGGGYQTVLEAQDQGVSYQQSCRISGISSSMGCVVIIKRFTGNEPVASLDITDAMLKATAQNIRQYAVVYELMLVKGGLNDNIGINVSHSNDIMMIDLSVSKPSYAWMVTADGGKSWSAPMTQNMDNVIKN